MRRVAVVEQIFVGRDDVGGVAQPPPTSSRQRQVGRNRRRRRQIHIVVVNVILAAASSVATSVVAVLKHLVAAVPSFPLSFGHRPQHSPVPVSIVAPPTPDPTTAGSCCLSTVDGGSSPSHPPPRKAGHQGGAPHGNFRSAGRVPVVVSSVAVVLVPVAIPPSGSSPSSSSSSAAGGDFGEDGDGRGAGGRHFRTQGVGFHVRGHLEAERAVVVAAGHFLHPHANRALPKRGDPVRAQCAPGPVPGLRARPRVLRHFQNLLLPHHLVVVGVAQRHSQGHRPVGHHATFSVPALHVQSDARRGPAHLVVPREGVACAPDW
mmetsp:Transcript_51684/g.103761  ORF Transcript_51684/g.103761 Transcript_51684/m.103761 type:complete len:319 (-) Transcript_51684:605-1561(-)